MAHAPKAKWNFADKCVPKCNLGTREINVGIVSQNLSGYIGIMIGDIRKHLEEHRIFIPFTIHMADGRNLRVPTRDHLLLVGSRAIVSTDDDDYHILPGLLMSGLTIDASPEVAGLP